MTLALRSIQNATRCILSLLLATLLLGCASTELNTTWKDPDTTGPLSFKKVVVLVLNSVPGERRAQEDELVAQIKKTPALPSYTLVSDSDLGNRDLVKRKIIESGADGAAVVRIIDARNEATYIPGTYNYWNAGTGYGAYYNSGQYVINTIVRAEVSLYSVPEGKLLWAGSSKTTDPENAKDFAMKVAHAAAAELKKQGLLQ
jgi:hypothetical protein